MRALVDTNVVLDVLLDRHPFARDATAVFTNLENSVFVGYLSPTTITTIYDLAAKQLGREAADFAVKSLLALFDTTPVNRIVLSHALALGWPDYEDAVIYQSGLLAGVDVIVTRDRKGFAASDLPVMPPQQFLTVLAARER